MVKAVAETPQMTSQAEIFLWLMEPTINKKAKISSEVAMGDKVTNSEEALAQRGPAEMSVLMALGLTKLGKVEVIRQDLCQAIPSRWVGVISSLTELVVVTRLDLDKATHSLWVEVDIINQRIRVETTKMFSQETLRWIRRSKTTQRTLGNHTIRMRLILDTPTQEARALRISKVVAIITITRRRGERSLMIRTSRSLVMLISKMPWISQLCIASIRVPACTLTINWSISIESFHLRWRTQFWLTQVSCMRWCRQVFFWYNYTSYKLIWISTN